MIYKFFDCELDSDLFELRKAGAAVPVEPQVFDLLRHLVEHADRAVTKEELFDAVWQGRFVSEAALTSRIKSARQAIGDTGRDQVMIKTVRGRGFRFVAPVETPGAAPHAAEPEATPSRERPSIAVLPFGSFGAEGGAPDYLADGVADEITMLLSRLRWLKVIARDSSFTFRDAQDARHVGRSLGARYLLEGGVARAQSRLRVSVRLVSADDGAQLWSEHYDRDIAHVFEVQDEIAQAIAGTLEPELAGLEEAVARRKPPESLTAWECYLRGRARLFSFTDEGLADAERLFSRAIAIDPSLSRAHAGQSYVYIQEAFYGDPAQRPEALDAALASARRAVAADPRDALGHFALGRAHSLRRETAEAEAALRTALEINPSFAQAHFALGFLFTASRRPEEALPCFERFSILSPWDPHSWTNHHMHAMACYWLDDLPGAKDYARRAVRQPNATRWPFATLVSVLGTAGRRDAAHDALQRLLERKPDYSIAVARDDFFFLDDPENEERYLAGLRAAGVREG